MSSAASKVPSIGEGDRPCRSPAALFCAVPPPCRPVPPWHPPLSAGRAPPDMTMKLSSSQANDPKYANGRVYYDYLLERH